MVDPRRRLFSTGVAPRRLAGYLYIRPIIYTRDVRESQCRTLIAVVNQAFEVFTHGAVRLCTLWSLGRAFKRRLRMWASPGFRARTGFSRSLSRTSQKYHDIAELARLESPEKEKKKMKKAQSHA
ncbi:hypothetical protein M0657_007474 [Pyricularia oryzae]|uniref:Uncharacterized protein n=2 Tax=Pyricularia oryzae TaxID=318829 RepID=A0AA97PNP0_PYRO3|nr:hypothetical protein OOU_Y34scaffold00288g17 [Pyricularia oryzae Y34]KAI7918705.1 hypothetical protein M0657_007474 [Pyricularia oryzae]